MLTKNAKARRKLVIVANDHPGVAGRAKIF